MRDGERAPAAVLLGLMLVAIAVGIVVTPESVAPRCEQVDPRSPPAFRLAPSYVPDGFALGGSYLHRGVELWFPQVDPAGFNVPSTWFSVYGSAPDSGMWQDRLGDGVEAGPDADHATRYDDRPPSELDVLLWREGSAWAAVEYVGLPEVEARAIATSVQQLTPHDWEKLRRSSSSYEELSCATP